MCFAMEGPAVAALGSSLLHWGKADSEGRAQASQALPMGKSRGIHIAHIVLHSAEGIERDMDAC